MSQLIKPAHIAVISSGLCLGLVGCQVEQTTAAGEAKTAKVAPSEAKPTKAEPTRAEPEPEPEPAPNEPPKAAPAGDRAQVSTDVAIPLPNLLGKTPAEVEKHLGEPLTKGRRRDSCLRFVPERVWFECSWVWQRYADKTKTFEAIQVTYEDGTSAAVSFEHLPGAGEFVVEQALSHVGLKLPGEPKLTEPEPHAKVWRWFNDQARLVIGGQQYRVLLSVREGKWEHSKLDVILNSPLTNAQKAKIKEAKGKTGRG